MCVSTSACTYVHACLSTRVQGVREASGGCCGDGVLGRARLPMSVTHYVVTTRVFV